MIVSNAPRRRVLVVVQRYGEEVVGGSESHARIAARRLALRHDVEVATTTALDFWTWAPHYRISADRVDGIPVRRFPVVAGRAADFKETERRTLLEEHALADETLWPVRQGPNVPELLEFLHRESVRYDVIFFYTYIYSPTVLGLALAPERAVLVATAHDEPALALAPYRALFRLPRAIGYLTPEERDLVHERFHNEEIPDEVLGIGLNPAPDANAAAFRARHSLVGPVVLYLGQVSEGKGCDELLRAWVARDEAGAGGTLVLAGPLHMWVPDRPDVRALGWLSEEDKWAALAAADVCVLPSRFESLGIVLLEAWQVGTPVLVRSDNAVTAGQMRRAGGGLAYATDAEFHAALVTLLAEGRARGAAGRAYVERECSWEAFDARLENLVELAAFDD